MKIDENPNKVNRHHFERAVELSRKCTPEKEGKAIPMVGAVIVIDGKIISEAYRNQTGSGDHAEYIALEHRIADKTAFADADLITTLEPCTKRKHGKEKKPCSEWIVLRRIRKVWIGTLDRNIDIQGVGEIWLQDAGIPIGRFPDDLAITVLELNRTFFDHISKQPRVPIETLEELAEEIRSEVKDCLESIQPQVDAYWSKHRGLYYKSAFRRMFWDERKHKASTRSWNDLQRGWFLISVLKDIRTELDMPSPTSSSHWSRIGNLLLHLHEGYLVPFEKELAGMDSFVHATMKRVYDERDRWDISRETSYDRTGQPTSNGTLGSWLKLRTFPVGLAWRAYDVSTELDADHYEGWLGKAKAELFRRKFEQCYGSLKKVLSIRLFDVSGSFIPASEMVGDDVASTLHWLARLIDIRHPTMVLPLIPLTLHSIQLDSILQLAKITGSVHDVIDLIHLLLKRPLEFDSDEDKENWNELGRTLTELGGDRKPSKVPQELATIFGELGGLCFKRLDSSDDKSETKSS